jgi:predicted neutral ceramidase superfamily lipid hydrolase
MDKAERRRCRLLATLPIAVNAAAMAASAHGHDALEDQLPRTLGIAVAALLLTWLGANLNDETLRRAAGLSFAVANGAVLAFTGMLGWACAVYANSAWAAMLLPVFVLALLPMLLVLCHTAASGAEVPLRCAVVATALHAVALPALGLWHDRAASAAVAAIALAAAVVGWIRAR